MKECLRDHFGGKTVLETGQRKEAQGRPWKVTVSLCPPLALQHIQRSAGPVTVAQPAPRGSLDPRRAAIVFGIEFLLFTDAELNGLQAYGICIMGAN